MSSLNNTRRGFIKQMLSISVFTAACPHILLGKGETKLNETADTLEGYFIVRRSQYPDLTEMWKSVRMSVDCIPPEENFPKILVCKVDKEKFGADYTAVLETCPHYGLIIKDMNSKFQVYECPGHGTIFDAAGVYIEGPASHDLIRFNTSWDGGDEVLIEIPGCVINSVNLESDNLSYLKQNYPNPCSDYTSIEYGVENPSDVIITVYDVLGNEVLNPVDRKNISGHFTLNLNVSSLNSGVYMCEMKINGIKTFSRTFLVKR